MVKGFDSFCRHFAGYEDCYTIIGGTACDILMDHAGREFRATKDIDMILLIDTERSALGYCTHIRHQRSLTLDPLMPNHGKERQTIQNTQA